MHAEALAHQWHQWRIALVFVLAAIGCSATALPVRAADEFYHGKTVSITLTTVGGIYGMNAHLLSRYLPKYLPGEPTAVISPKPGAGGLVNINYLANAAPRDGTTIGFVHKDAAVLQILSGQQAKFDVAKFHWIGSVFPMNSVLFVTRKAAAQSLDAARTHEVVMGATGRSHPTSIFPTFLNSVFGTRFKVVAGYRGSADVFKALDAGEVSGSTFAWDQVLTLRSEWVTRKEIRPLVQVSTEKAPELPDVPLLVDLMRSTESKRIAAFLVSGSKVGMAVVAPPGVPDARVRSLRQAFDAVMRDPGYLAEAHKAKLTVEPVAGAKIEALLKGLMAHTSPAFNDKLKTAIGLNGS